MRALASIDVSELAAYSRDIVARLKMEIVDLRLEARDYEYAGTRREQQQHAQIARTYIEAIRQDMLTLSENVFSAIDVVEFSTILDNLMECLG